jgi:CheY-like chemotaxis protein
MDNTRGIPVVALSAAATQNDIDNGIRNGFLHYLTKPMQILEMPER